MSEVLEELEAENPSAYPPSIQGGIPKLGDTPKGWTRYRLGDLLHKVERPAKLVDSETYQLVTAKRNRGGIVAREILRGDQIRTKTQFYVEAGDFLISNRQISHGACGIVHESLNRAVVSNEYTAFHTADALDPAFLNALSHSIYFQQTCFHSSIGVHVEKLVFRLEDWMGWEFDIPPLHEQKRIVALLGTWDRAINQAECLTTSYRRNRAALMLKLFGPAKVTRESVLPAGWRHVRVGDLCEITSGLWVGTDAPLTKVGVIRNTNFTEDGILDVTDIALIEVEEKQLKSRTLSVGDIILEKSGGSPDQPVGRVALFELEDGLFSFSNFTSVLRIKDTNNVHFHFLHSFLHWVYLSGLTEVMQTRSTGIRNLDGQAYQDIIVPLPPFEEQKRIVQLLRTNHALLITCIQSLEALRIQKRGLMQKLLTGERQLDQRFDRLAQVVLTAAGATP